MSGFTIRRFVLQNITAVAAHCPSPAIASAAVAVMTGHTATAAPSSSPSSAATAADASSTTTTPSGSAWVRRMLVGAPTSSSSTGFGLVTEAEMEWIRRRRREDAEESRVVLATRPGRSMLRGAGGAVLNSVLGFVVSPMVFLAVTLERIRLGTGVASLLTGPCYGFLWGGVFFTCAQYAAVQQVVLCGYYSLVATPLYFCINRRPAASMAHRPRGWWFGVLSCRFEAPQGTLHARHPMLLLYDDVAVLRERAMKRLASRDKDRTGKKDAHYRGKEKRGAAGPDDDDYYGLLGVAADATARQIKEAYSQKALYLHPDRNPSPNAAQEFDRVTKAYRVLSNPQKRKKFDLAGTKGVEDTGVKKREGVRALFGGEELNRLTGDVFLGSFSQRVIDGLDYTAEELAVVRQNMYESCRDELLSSYLVHYDPSSTSATAAAAKTATAAATKRAPVGRGPWKGDGLSLQLRKMLNTGLSKEVLFTLGHEYKRVLACFDMEETPSAAAAAAAAADAASAAAGTSTSLPSLAVQRVTFYAGVVSPHRWELRRRTWTHLTKVRSHTFRNSAAMVDLAWYTSVHELEATARYVAAMILYDPSLTADERATRRDALAALAELFIAYGQPYKGASKTTMDQLMQSLREYQHQRQREKDAQ